MRKRKRLNPFDLISPAEAAKTLGCSTTWLRALASRGVIAPAMRMPDGVRLYYRADVERFRDDRR